MKLLNAQQILQKTKRLAIEVLENNCEESEIILAGVNSNGMAFAQMLHKAMGEISIVQPKITLINIKLNPAKPIEEKVSVEIPLEELKGRVVVLVDDVANTGRTLQYAMRPLLDVLVKKIELAVLVDRKHKTFPVRPNYVGMELATTLMNNIEVRILDVNELEHAVYLN